MTPDQTTETNGTQDSPITTENAQGTEQPGGTDTGTDKPDTSTDAHDEIDLDAEPDGAPLIDDSPKNDEGSEDDEDGLTEEDKKLIDKYVSKRVQSIEQQNKQTAEALQNQRINGEIDNIIAKNPEYKPYEALVRKWVNHPNRIGHVKKGLPVSAVVAEALAPYQQRIGAARAKAADEKANRSRDEGTQSKQTQPKSVNWNEVSNADMVTIIEQVKAGKYKQ